MSKINFQPWVGGTYESGGIIKQKILVLGDSHYCAKEEGCRGVLPEECPMHCPKFTIDVILQYLNAYDGRGSQQTYLCFERAVMGKELSDEEKKAFWNSIVFYNYVQTTCLNDPRQAPKAEHYRSSEDAFKELLETFQPAKIIVWGKRLYNALPDWGGYAGEVKISNGDTTDVWHYNINGRDIPAMVVYHPSCPQGKKWEYWHEFYETFFY